MQGQRARRTTTLAGISLLALALAGCGGSPEQQLAQDVCSAFEALADGDMSALEDLEGMEQRFDEGDFSEAEFDAALRSECPDVFDMFGDF